MDLLTFIIIIVIICTLKDLIKRKHHEPHSDKSGKNIYQEIDDLKQRLYDLENSPGIKRIEKRLQALETIVVDSDYQLSMKFKRELEGETKEYRNI